MVGADPIMSLSWNVNDCDRTCFEQSNYEIIFLSLIVIIIPQYNDSTELLVAGVFIRRAEIKF